MLFMFAPVAAQVFVSGISDDYMPQLPLADAKESTGQSFSTARQLYPPLTDTEIAYNGNAIIIPAIEVNVPTALSPSMDDDSVLETLAYGAAMYPNGVKPGHLGNVFIAAHSTGEPWKGKYRFAFLRLNELEAGNLIHLDYEGTRYTYRIVKEDIVKPDPSYTIASDRPIPTVTLMACWPLWSTSQRMLITAELANVTQMTPRPF